YQSLSHVHSRLFLLIFFFQCNGHLRDLHSFPTRRSSDLYTTFQIIWRLWKPGEVKRVLFLVDRNVLVDQTLVNDFKPFGRLGRSDRKSTRLNSSHLGISYAVFCLKKKK